MALFNQRIDVYYHHDVMPDECDHTDDVLNKILESIRRFAGQQDVMREQLSRLNYRVERLIKLHEGQMPQVVSEAIKESAAAADEVRVAIDATQ